MRKSLSILLEGDSTIEIIGTAKNGQEGYDMVKKLRPDIVTLDIEMPIMDGLTCLKKIMKDYPTPVMMVSSLTTEGAESTLTAMELGAVDFIPKELSYVNVNFIKIKEELIRKVKTIVRQQKSKERLAKLRKINKPSSTPNFTENKLPANGFKAIAIGVSTGGPLSLQKVIPRINSPMNMPIFIVQHMPPKFTKSLADRLNNLSSIEVKEAENDDVIRNGVAYIAPGGYQMKIIKSHNSIKTIKITETPVDTLHKPSVDVMLNSVVEIYNNSVLAIIMTGMGKDGLNAVTKLKGKGGYCIAQDEQSSIVYGMPKAIADAGLADNIVPLEDIVININKVNSYGRNILRTHI